MVGLSFLYKVESREKMFPAFASRFGDFFDGNVGQLYQYRRSEYHSVIFMTIDINRITVWNILRNENDFSDVYVLCTIFKTSRFCLSPQTPIQ